MSYNTIVHSVHTHNSHSDTYCVQLARTIICMKPNLRRNSTTSIASKGSKRNDNKRMYYYVRAAPQAPPTLR